MSKLAKYGLEAQAVKSTSKKAKAPLVEVKQENLKIAIDRYAELYDEIQSAQNEMKECEEAIRDLALDNALKTESADFTHFKGNEATVGVVFKDQYSIKSDMIDGIREMFKAHKLKTETYLTEATEIAFKFDAMSEKEREKLFGFLSKEFGPDRFKELVSEKTSYSIKGFVGQMPKVAKNREDFDEIRRITGHYSPTIAKAK